MIKTGKKPSSGRSEAERLGGMRFSWSEVSMMFADFGYDQRWALSFHPPVWTKNSSTAFKRP